MGSHRLKDALADLAGCRALAAGDQAYIFARATQQPAGARIVEVVVMQPAFESGSGAKGIGHNLVARQLICCVCQLMMFNAELTTQHFFSPVPVNYRRMRRFPIDQRMANALRVLRLRAQRPLKSISPHVGVSPQVMSRWETGTAPVPEDRLPLFLEALGASSDDLHAEMELASVQGLAHDPVRIAAAPDPMSGLEFVEVRDESMSPWAEPGERVWFRRGQHPKRYEGCVAEMMDGRQIIRKYERGEGGHIFLLRLNPHETERYMYSEVKAIHRIAQRGD